MWQTGNPNAHCQTWRLYLTWQKNTWVASERCPRGERMAINRLRITKGLSKSRGEGVRQNTCRRDCVETETPELLPIRVSYRGTIYIFLSLPLHLTSFYISHQSHRGPHLPAMDCPSQLKLRPPPVWYSHKTPINISFGRKPYWISSAQIWHGDWLTIKKNSGAYLNVNHIHRTGVAGA